MGEIWWLFCPSDKNKYAPHICQCVMPFSFLGVVQVKHLSFLEAPWLFQELSAGKKSDQLSWEACKQEEALRNRIWRCDDESLKMIKDSQEKELPNKQGSTAGDKARNSIRLWPGLKDPRIVRVSRAFGGKDRHSKVTTVRGLRDRRVRLSVPTAIQLYDLQDRLGLNQPSKVVDWLLNAAQHEIDKLPPLQMPPGNFIQFPHQLQMSHEATPCQAPSCPPGVENLEYTTENGARPLALFSSKPNHEVFGSGVAIEDLATLSKSDLWHSNVSQKTKQRETMRESGMEKGDAIKGNEMDQDGIHCAQVSAYDPLSRPPYHASVGLLSNAMPYTCYYQWEPTNAFVSHLGIHSAPVEGPPTSNPSSLSLASASQLVFCPPGVMPSVFDFDPKQFSHVPVVSSASQNTPFNSPRTSLR